MFQEYGEDYGLGEVEEPTFQRCTGFRSRIAAIDTVLSVTALLEERSSEDAQEASDPSSNDGWQNSFWQAYEAMPGKDQKYPTPVKLLARFYSSIVTGKSHAG